MLEEKDNMHAQICNLNNYVLKLKQNIRILNSKCYRLKNKKVTTNNKKIVCKNEIKNGVRHTHSIKMFAFHKNRYGTQVQNVIIYYINYTR